MKKANKVMGEFDEYQLMMRYRYGYQSFMLMMGLLIILMLFENIAYTQRAMILLVVPMMYFFTRVIISNAYTGVRGKAIPLGSMFLAVSILQVIVTCMTPSRITEGIIISVFTGYIGSLILIKEYLNRKNIEE